MPAAGRSSGDKLVAVDGERGGAGASYVEAIQPTTARRRPPRTAARRRRPATLTIERDGKQMQISLTPV